MLRLYASRRSASHPSRGAWIEILGVSLNQVFDSRTPHGVRGLKSQIVKDIQYRIGVAPLTGCVD